ncbi:hypothetical protein [Bacteroides sp.]|uniref:hypothetical protein n=1 Tax=Bacteroides sp. TaxID=29523 RepID=UPI00262CE92E|nr:hypothetical protein [Bacteroides sp.]MDD3040704.1 hypothetical protein [Bacteroides sp.]
MDNTADFKNINTIQYTVTKTPLCPHCGLELVRSNKYMDPNPPYPIYLCKNRCIESTSTIAEIAAELANNDPTFKHKFRLALAYFNLNQYEFAKITGFSTGFVYYQTIDGDFRKCPPNFAIHAIYLIERMALDKTMKKIQSSYINVLGLDLKKTIYTQVEE